MRTSFASRALKRRGYSLLELVVVVGIASLLLALLIPAVLMVRESSRFVKCQSNLRQIGLAVSNYLSAHQMFPPGQNACGFSLYVSILPYLGEPDPDLGGVCGPEAMSTPKSLVSRHLSIYQCPSDSMAATPLHGVGGTSYLGNSGTGVQKFGYNGLFRYLKYKPELEGPIRLIDVKDGVSNTVAFAESLQSDGTFTSKRAIYSTVEMLDRREDLELFASACDNFEVRQSDSGKFIDEEVQHGRPWSFGQISTTLYNHVLTPNKYSCYNNTFVQLGAYTSGSSHHGGVNVLFADGHGKFVADSVNRSIWRAAGSVNGSEPLRAEF